MVELGFGAFACICWVEGLIWAHCITHTFTTFFQMLRVTILTLIQAFVMVQDTVRFVDFGFLEC